MELAGCSCCHWSPLFQVTTYACILAEPFQGHAIFSIDNLDIHNKSGFGLKSGQQICKGIKICFLAGTKCVRVCVCLSYCVGGCDRERKREREKDE